MTAKDLLYKILEYSSWWSSPDIQNAKPVEIRLAQIEILLKAFGLTKENVNPIVQGANVILGNKEKLTRTQYLNRMTSVEYVLNGEFLYNRKKEMDKKLLDKVFSKITSLYPDRIEDIKIKSFDTQLLFKDLIRYRQKIYKINSPIERILEGFSIGLHYSFYLQQQLNEVINSNISAIDDTLWEILDPLKRDIKKEELNYPDPDLEKIDQEWQNERW